MNVNRNLAAAGLSRGEGFIEKCLQVPCERFEITIATSYRTNIVKREIQE